MSVKAVDMVRKIRDRHYEQTKGMSVEEQIRFINKKAARLKAFFKKRERSSSGAHHSR